MIKLFLDAHKVGGMTNAPEFTRGMVTIPLEQKVTTPGMKPAA
jgi:hypothetical protein